MKFLTDFTYRNLHGFALFPGDSTALVTIPCEMLVFKNFTDQQRGNGSHENVCANKFFGTTQLKVGKFTGMFYATCHQRDVQMFTSQQDDALALRARETTHCSC